MEREKLLKADYLDIIFDDRNKAYGGYELRKNYSRRTRNASSIVLFVAAVGFAIPALAGILKKPEAEIKMPKRPPIVCGGLQPPPKELPKPIHVEAAQPAQPKLTATATFIPPTIVENDKVKPDEILTQNDKLHDKQIGSENHAGDAATGSISIPTNQGPPGDGLGGPATVETGIGKSNTPFTYVEQMPSFNGDISAYLNSHTQYPDQAKEASIQGRVIVQFVVNEDGSVSNAEIKQSASPMLDREALRVINAMPHWKAGKQNGNAVKVYFTLPITFTLE